VVLWGGGLSRPDVAPVVVPGDAQIDLIELAEAGGGEDVLLVSIGEDPAVLEEDDALDFRGDFSGMVSDEHEIPFEPEQGPERGGELQSCGEVEGGGGFV
jgi:hypothetical protein